MATVNSQISGPGWSLIVPAGTDFLLTLPQASQTIYVATNDDDEDSSDSEPPADSVIGHALRPGSDGMNRALLGPGDVYARHVDSATSVTLALTTWAPT